jgi:hypothetical protein
MKHVKPRGLNEELESMRRDSAMADFFMAVGCICTSLICFLVVMEILL